MINTHSPVLFYMVGATLPICSLLLPLMLPVFSLNILGNVTLLATNTPLQRCACARRGPGPPPLTCSFFDQIRTGYLMASNNLVLVGFPPFMARKERAVGGRGTWLQRPLALNHGGPPQYNSACMKRNPSLGAVARWQFF